MFFLERLKLGPWEGRREGKGCPARMQRDTGGKQQVEGLSSSLLLPYGQAGGANRGCWRGWGSRKGRKATITLMRNVISSCGPQPQPKVGWDLAGRASAGDGVGGSPSRSRAEGQELGAEHSWGWRIERGSAKFSWGSSMCVRPQENPAWGKD